MSTERQMELGEHQIDEADLRVAQLLNLLRLNGWQTRKDIAAYFLWDERTVRAVAEAAGTKVVRGQKGFNHIDRTTPEELNACAGPFMSQGKHMFKIGLAWKRAAKLKTT